jgi:PAS domain S-box-containing protein
MLDTDKKAFQETDVTRLALEQSQQKFRRILASMADVAWTSDCEGRTRYVSPKVETILGYTKDEICASASGNSLRIDLIHPEDFGRVGRSYRSLFENQRAFDEEYRVRRKDGTWIWIHDRATGTYEENGILYADGVFADITQRKKEEAELLWKTAFLEAQTNATIDGIVVVNSGGRRLLQNQRLIELFKIPPEIAADENDKRTLKYVLSLVKDAESFLAKVQWLYRNPSETSRDEIELKNGTFIDRYSAPVIDKEGTYYGRVWTFRDITERKRAERELRLTKASLENASTAVFWVDRPGHIVYANEAACRSLERSREELLALSIPDIDPLFPQDAWDSFWQECGEKHSSTFETQHQTKSGRIFPAEVTASFLEFDGQQYIFAFVRDITERRELESQLRQAHKLEGIGQLAAGIAHEINTPTQFVTDNLTFLNDSWKAVHKLLDQYRGAVRNAAGVDPVVRAQLEENERECDLDFIVAEVPRAIDQSIDGSRRVTKIVRAMKEFSHPDSAEKTLTDLNRAIESTVTVARHEWKYVAEVVTELEQRLPPVMCYPGDINQVVLNLLVNAAHAIQGKAASGEKGQITIRTHAHDEFAEIAVTDTGTGIPEAIRNKVFDPFFTTKEVGKGTGQGLSLAHAVIVKKHSGKIWFETKEGHGTTFFIDLPVRPDPPIQGK